MYRFVFLYCCSVFNGESEILKTGYPIVRVVATPVGTGRVQPALNVNKCPANRHKIVNIALKHTKINKHLIKNE